MDVLITGVSSGLGAGFLSELEAADNQIFGLARRKTEIKKGRFVSCDLSELGQIEGALEKLLNNVVQLDLVILNAGILGEIAEIQNITLKDLKKVMDINLWSNKVILDFLIRKNIEVKQIVAISSGAASYGNKGWGGYSLSKAGLNILMQLYSHEMKKTHIVSLAPGLIDTAMQDYLCEKVDTEKFQSVARLKAARGSSDMPNGDLAAKKILSHLVDFKHHASGSFLDLREF